MASEYSLVDRIRQSPPLDTSQNADDTWIRGKTILITGGASGFGEGFFRRWAVAGATVIIGDVNTKKGEQLVQDVKKETGNDNLHFCHCDVTDWQSQVELFRAAIKVSPHGGIDTVVANAGIVDPRNRIETPHNLDAPEPPAPVLKTIDVNLKGVLYTAHLALFYLPRNPGSSAASPTCDPQTLERDRHLILMASIAGLLPVPFNCLYSTSKHAVVGLYRSLRASSFVDGVRVNMICPYFIDTPLLTVPSRIILAGTAVGKPEDVIEAGSRFTSDPRICGRAVAGGAKVKAREDADGQWILVEEPGSAAEGKAIQEIYVNDFEEAEIVTKKVIRLWNHIAKVKGWVGWAKDMIAALRYGLGS